MIPERVSARRRGVAGWLPPLAVVAVVGAIYFPLTTRFLQGQGDFASHIERAEDLTRGVLEAPHILFHTLVAAGIVAGADSRDAALVVTLSLQIAASLAVLWYIRAYTSAGPVVAPVLAILVLAAGPVVPPADRGLFMLGYFLPNALHNPTVIAGKVFIPFLLAIGTSAVGWTTRPRMRSAVAAPIVVLAGLAKPHYVSCVVGAVAAVSAARALRRRPVPWRLLGLGLVVPSAAVLGWVQFGTIEFAGGGSAVLAPLTVLGRYVPVDPGSMLQRLASDIAFPLSVAVLWPAAVVRFPPLMLGWAAYGVGLGQALLLAESGSRMFDGNFFWSGQMATFGLMTASAACLGEESSGGRLGWRSVVAWTILLVHVAFWSWWAVHRLNS